MTIGSYILPNIIIWDDSYSWLIYMIYYTSALKFQLQIEGPCAHNVVHFISETGFKKCTQGPHFVAKDVF